MQLFRGATHAGGADDRAHAVGDLQVLHRLAQLVALFALDAPRNAAAARIVRHQDEEAAREADERGEGGALVATLFLLDLHHQVLAFLQEVADVQAAARLGTVAEVVLGHLLERQEAMALRAVVDERGFEARLDARDSTFVDVGFFLFSGGNLDGQVVQLLAINQCDAQLFLLSCIDKHSLHLPLLLA